MLYNVDIIEGVWPK